MVYYEDMIDDNDSFSDRMNHLDKINMYSFNCFKINCKTKNGKNVKVDCFYSGQQGTYIRNAFTGEMFKNKVGSNDEYMFFKMYLCNGINEKREPILLFYNTPEECERHLLMSIDNNIKQKWHQKYIQYKSL